MCCALSIAENAHYLAVFVKNVVLEVVSCYIRYMSVHLYQVIMKWLYYY